MAWNGQGPLTSKLAEVVRAWGLTPERCRETLPPPDGVWRRIPPTVQYRIDGRVLTHWRCNEDGTVQFRAAGG